MILKVNLKEALPSGLTSVCTIFSTLHINLFSSLIL